MRGVATSCHDLYLTGAGEDAVQFNRVVHLIGCQPGVAALRHPLLSAHSLARPASPLSISTPLPKLSRPFTTIHFPLSLSTMSTSHLSDEPILNSNNTRPMSIDFSLELERQLEAESVPNSPNPPRPQSLDATVLATIVTHLRQSLTETTKERDTLVEKLTEAQTREEGMRDTLEHVTDKCIRMENDLEVALNRHKEDAETIAMLRSKLEDSRCVRDISSCSLHP